jgi:hypothetical protein
MYRFSFQFIYVVDIKGHYICLGEYNRQKFLTAMQPGPKPPAVFDEYLFFPEVLLETLHKYFVRFAAKRRITIVNPQSVFSSLGQSGLAKIGQMPRGRGLRNIQYRDDMTNAQLAVLQKV